MKSILIICIFFCSLFLSSQSQSSNNLREEKLFLNDLKNSKTLSDSSNAYNNLVNLYVTSNLTQANVYYKKAYIFYQRNKMPISEASLYEFMADAYWYSGEYKTSMEFYLKVLRIGDSLNNKKIIAKSKYNIGWIKTLQLNQFDKVNYFYEALQTFNTLKDTAYIIQLHDALGNYYKQVPKSSVKHKNDSCLKYFLSCKDLINNSNFKRNEAGCYANIASFYIGDENYQKAREYSLIGVASSEKTSDEYNLVASLSILADCYYHLDSLSKAKKILIDLNKYLASPVHEPARLNVYAIYTNIFRKEKNYKEALMYSERFNALSDSINKKIFSQNLLQKENDYKLEKKDKALNELQLKTQLQTVKNKQNSYIIIGLGIFGLLVLIIVYFLFRSNTQKQQTNKLLSFQNGIINEKNKEIHQSMQYASRIQHALMPTQKYIVTNLNRLKKK